MDDTNTDKTELAKTDNELKVIFSAHDDWRRVVAAGKVQRWDVVKWGVTVNTALAALAATVTISLRGALGLFVIAVVVAFMSWRLMSHYNLRITRAREDARKLVDQMKKKYDIDYDNITDKHVALDYVGPTRDEGELQMFKGALIMSSLLPLLVALSRTLAN